MFNGLFKNNNSKSNEKNTTDLDLLWGESSDTSHSKEKVDEWIWVDGFKGTDKDMVCRDTQYELHKVFKHDGDISLCNSGYHFCQKLEDIFQYYDLMEGNRFFKVRALVRASEWKSPTSAIQYGLYFLSDSKNVAKEIEFIEEVSYDELKEHVDSRFPMIETEEEYKACEDYEGFCICKFAMEMEKLGFSPLYSKLQLDDIDNGNWALYQLLKYAKSLCQENISKDLLVYMLEQRKYKLINGGN